MDKYIIYIYLACFYLTPITSSLHIVYYFFPISFLLFIPFQNVDTVQQFSFFIYF